MWSFNIAAAAIVALASADVSRTEHGVAARFGVEGVLTAEVGSETTFRLGVRFGGWENGALSTPSLNPAKSMAPYTVVSWGGMTGVHTTFGSLLVSNDGTGGWALYSASNATLVTSGGPPSTNNGTSSIDAGIILPVSGAAAASGPARPCLSNGEFGSQFYLNRNVTGDGLTGYMAFAVSAWDWDPANHHCYPISFSGAIGSEEAREPALASQDWCDPSLRHNSTDADGAQRSEDYPNGLTVKTIDDCCAACNKDPTCNAYIWSDGTAPDPNGNCWPLASFTSLHPAAGRVFAGTPPPPPQQAWWAMGSAADWYLAPTAVGPLGMMAALNELTGPAAIPNRYAFGFMATYWGYETMEYVEGNMTAFRDGAYPIDSFIMDYDWWNTPQNPDADFDYDPKMFGNHSFIHPPGSTIPNANTSGPVQLFQHFHRDLNMRFGGIRKPRTYSNINFCNASGWLLPDNFSVGAGDNNWNMSAPGWFDWYVGSHLHFLQDGLDYWWNDEGETQWFTYTWWNAAQQAEYAQALPNQRFGTLNRAFQPGMQRFPAVTWTGDRQDCAHKTVLTFTTAGQPYTACDMTAPDATVLVRQYQNAVFLPIMRTHAMHGVPRFPYYWGGAEHQAAFRGALQLRYAFIPHIYSLAHFLRATGQPMALPASYIFPNDPTFPPSVGDATYMFSDVLLPADVSTSNGQDPNENTTHVNIPPGLWYTFNSTQAMTGPQVGLTYTNVPLTQLMLFVRAGAILCLNKAVVQYTDALGGDLVIQVYRGRDGAFTLVEDDGASLDYQQDAVASTRRTYFVWKDASKNLSWNIAGGYLSGPNLYTTLWPVLFDSATSAPQYLAPVALTMQGNVSF